MAATSLLAMFTSMGSVKAEDRSWIARGRQGMVATESEHASLAGLEMLRAGGNAVDAAVAASFSLAVSRPWHTGLGGGGFMIARMADGRVVVQDFRETAPAAADAKMFQVSQQPAGLPASEVGWRAAAVPGLVAGRCQALAQLGTMPLDRVLAPAIRLADAGWPVDAPYIEAVSEVVKRFEEYPSLRKSCAYVWQRHLREGKPWKPGEMLRLPELARSFRGVAEKGADFFYRGPVAETIAATMEANGGFITKEDLASYRPKYRELLRSTYRDYELILMPPPSSGGVAITEILNLLEALDYAAAVKRDPATALHWQIEAFKHAFADRAAWLGDPDFVSVPVDRLTDKSAARGLARVVNGRPGQGEPERYGVSQVPDDGGTSHICVVDALGNAVVTTETINTEFGALVAVGEWGLILNNEMDDFTTSPGEPNAFGLVQGETNEIAPNKRPLSSMSPTIVLKDGKPYLLLGAAGGPRIITAVVQVMLSVLDEGAPLDEALSRPRVHHQWRPNEVYFDQRPPPSTLAEALKSRGHRLSDRKKKAVVQAIQRTEDGWIGAADPRGGGRPAGY